MKSYRIDNWSEYNQSLVNRGSLTLWITPEIAESWSFKGASTPKGGRPFQYSDDMILCMLQLREVFSLTLRATQGFVASLLEMAGIEIPVPNYTVLCRRAKRLEKKLKRLGKQKSIEIVVDSTGLKVAGGGEWNARKHGKKGQRQWRKVHIAIDPATHQIVSLVTTGATKSDASVLPKLLDQIPGRITSVYGDGAYDGKPCREAIHKRGSRCLVPPPKNAVLRRDRSNAIEERNEWVRIVRGLGEDEIARGMAKKLLGYHKRSLVETSMYRLKSQFGGSLRSRTSENQDLEVALRCEILNQFSELGMPKSCWA